MKARCLSIPPELLIDMFSRTAPQGFSCGKNVLPKDARVVEIDVDLASGAPSLIHLWIESAVFQDSDPDELPPVELFAYEHPARRSNA